MSETEDASATERKLHAVMQSEFMTKPFPGVPAWYYRTIIDLAVLVRKNYEALEDLISECHGNLREPGWTVEDELDAKDGK